MLSSVERRLARVEDRLLPPPPRQKEYCRLVTDESEAAEREKLAAEGVDPDGENVMWIWLVPGQFQADDIWQEAARDG